MLLSVTAREAGAFPMTHWVRPASSWAAHPSVTQTTSWNRRVKLQFLYSETCNNTSQCTWVKARLHNWCWRWNPFIWSHTDCDVSRWRIFDNEHVKVCSIGIRQTDWSQTRESENITEGIAFVLPRTKSWHKQTSVISPHTSRYQGGIFFAAVWVNTLRQSIKIKCWRWGV